MDRAELFAIMSAFPTGVTVVTTLDAEGQPRGLTCNAVSSVSADPPMLLVCVDRQSSTLQPLRDARRFVVNFLVEGRGELANRFATKELEKFSGVPWRPARNGMPWLYADTLAYAECATDQEIEAGDHVVFIARVEAGQPPSPGTQPLMYFRRTYASWPKP